MASSPHHNDAHVSPSPSMQHGGICKRLWEAKLPVQVSLSQAEMAVYFDRTERSLELNRMRTRPLLTMAFRCSYLPLLLPQIRKHFDQAFTVVERQLQQYEEGEQSLMPWFEFDGRPLSWHYPIGHLHDECHFWLAKRENSTSPDGLLLPWQLTLHLRDYPTSHLLPLSLPSLTREDGGLLRAHFYAMLKQADYLRHGSCRNVMNLSKNEQIQLWEGLSTASFEKFAKVNTKLICPSEASTWKRLPLRLYLWTEEQNLRKVLIPSTTSTNPTLQDLLHDNQLSETFHLISHGILLPPQTSLIWLVQNFVYPDGFLHLLLTSPRQ